MRPTRVTTAALLSLALTSLALFAACDDGGAASEATPTASTSTTTPGTSTASPSSTATAGAGGAGSKVLARNTPDAARAMQHLRTLTDIGPRAATTDGEVRAAEYLRGQLESFGYQANIEEFLVSANIGGSGSVRVADTSKPGIPMSSSPDGEATGPLVYARLGRESDYAGVDARGAVVLLDRGELTFAEKVRHAQAAGAAAVVVANNVAGSFSGDLGSEPVRIPALAILQAAGAELRDLVGRPATITSTTNRVNGMSRNVVGRPSDAPCTAYMGGHFDSVPAGPGANDNASGTSLLWELARARRIEGLCIIAFGSEEIGLFGSQAFVRDHDVQGAQFMLNFDMVAKHTRPTFIGDPDLTARAERIAQAQGVTVRVANSIGPGSSSDHATFQRAGVPVLMFYSGDDEFIHTAQDDFQNVSQADLAKFLDIAVALLDELYAI